MRRDVFLAEGDGAGKVAPELRAVDSHEPLADGDLIGPVGPEIAAQGQVIMRARGLHVHGGLNREKRGRAVAPHGLVEPDADVLARRRLPHRRHLFDLQAVLPRQHHPARVMARQAQVAADADGAFFDVQLDLPLVHLALDRRRLKLDNPARRRRGQLIRNTPSVFVADRDVFADFVRRHLVIEFDGAHERRLFVALGIILEVEEGADDPEPRRVERKGPLAFEGQTVRSYRARLHLGGVFGRGGEHHVRVETQLVRRDPLKLAGDLWGERDGRLVEGLVRQRVTDDVFGKDHGEVRGPLDLVLRRKIRNFDAGASIATTGEPHEEQQRRQAHGKSRERTHSIRHDGLTRYGERVLKGISKS